VHCLLEVPANTQILLSQFDVLAVQSRSQLHEFVDLLLIVLRQFPTVTNLRAVPQVVDIARDFVPKAFELLLLSPDEFLGGRALLGTSGLQHAWSHSRYFWKMLVLWSRGSIAEASIIDSLW
jgi:hypothetical protein